jgi:hypothetical protein
MRRAAVSAGPDFGLARGRMADKGNWLAICSDWRVNHRVRNLFLDEGLRERRAGLIDSNSKIKKADA